MSTPAAPVTPGTTNTQGLASWAAPYITDYLSKAQTLAKEPYQAYEGPLTAGPSALQTQAFQGIAGLTVPSSLTGAGTMATDFAKQAGASTYGPVGTTFTTQQAQQYMNPYLQAALDPQMKEMQRQADIARMSDAARLSKAGAFGGSRQAIMESEGRRNLLDKQSEALGQGYATAYDKAMAQFNADQARKVQEAQFGAGFGLDALRTGIQGAQAAGQLGEAANKAGLANLQQQLAGGEIQRGIQSEGIKADYDEFMRQKDDPYKKLQFQREMISGLPVSSVTSSPAQLSGIASLIGAVGGVDQLLKSTGKSSLMELLKGLGLGGE
jgi:hypothetical protein